MSATGICKQPGFNEDRNGMAQWAPETQLTILGDKSYDRKA